MPSYQYDKWAEQATPALQLDYLNKHIGEVTSRMGNEMSSGDQSTSSYGLQRYYDTLIEQRTRLLEINAVIDLPHGGMGRLILRP